MRYAVGVAGINGVVASFDPAQFHHASAECGKSGGVDLSACLTEISNLPHPALSLSMCRQGECHKADRANQELSTSDLPHFSLRERLNDCAGRLRPMCTETMLGRSCWLQAYRRGEYFGRAISSRRRASGLSEVNPTLGRPHMSGPDAALEPMTRIAGKRYSGFPSTSSPVNTPTTAQPPKANCSAWGPVQRRSPRAPQREPSLRQSIWLRFRTAANG